MSSAERAASGRLTTHVLDTMSGEPGAGIAVELFRLEGGRQQRLAEATTNAEGRSAAPLLQGPELRPGVYELRFHVGDYFRQRAVALCGTRFPRPRADPFRHRRRGAPLSCATSHFALRLFDLSWQLTIETGRCANRSDFCSARNCGSSIEVDPTLTVLDWLRLVERRTGTKEGCNEGDCGACTVAIGRLADGRLHYRAVNACIRFVGQLDGAQLLTVEDLAGPDGAPHPVQQALVECHGAQCGFCTPGFVMSLFALYQSDPTPDHSDTALSPERVDDALAGNLCRCTGYAPIVAAAHRMLQLSRGKPDRFAAERPDTLARLGSLQDEATLTVGDQGRWFHAPATVEALADLLLEHPKARIVAGATDVGLWVTKDLRVLERVIDIGRVRALQKIEDRGEALAIGAGATYADALPVLAKLYPDIGEVFRRLGGEQVRNVGTIGGNIANGSPIGDSPPMLIALGARLVLRKGSERREVPLEDFFIAYGQQDRRPSEFVEAIVVPKPTAGLRFRAYKIAKRFDQDISAVLGAFALTLEDGKVAAARIAYGGMAATPKRARNAETALTGQPWNEVALEAASAALAKDFTPISDWRASAGYRARVAANLLQRLYLETTDRSALTRLVGDRSLAHV